jgi:HTH-type transcriptional regulator/antitoxin HipB
MSLYTAKEIGALIRDHRRMKKLSQQDLAKRVGVSRLWLAQVEKGKPSAQLGLVLRTLRELGITLQAVVKAHFKCTIDLGDILKNQNRE